MKTLEEKQKFIQLRAQGLSFDRIAEKLQIGRRTLIDWSSKYQREIAELKSARLEALREQYCLAVEEKVRMWGEIVNGLKDRLVNSDFCGLTSDKLLDMLIKAQDRLERAYIEPVFQSEDQADQPEAVTEDDPSASKTENTGSMDQNCTKSALKLHQIDNGRPTKQI